MRIELLHRLIAGSTTEEENRQLMEWFRQCASREEFFKLFESAWKESPDEMPRDVQERMYRRLSRGLDEEKKQAKVIPLLSRFPGNLSTGCGGLHNRCFKLGQLQYVS